MQVNASRDFITAVGEREQTAKRMRTAMVSCQCRDLQKANSPASLCNCLVAPIVIRAFDMRMAGNPQIDRSSPMFIVKAIEEVLEDVRVFLVSEVFRVVILDEVIQ